MIKLKAFVTGRIADIQAEIDALPAGCAWERNADSLGIDKAFYETALEVVDEYASEQAFEHYQQSRSFTARLDRMGCRGGTP